MLTEYVTRVGFRFRFLFVCVLVTALFLFSLMPIHLQFYNQQTKAPQSLTQNLSTTRGQSTLFWLAFVQLWCLQHEYAQTRAFHIILAHAFMLSTETLEEMILFEVSEEHLSLMPGRINKAFQLWHWHSVSFPLKKCRTHFCKYKSDSLQFAII